jgi:hypothetical protein
LRRLISRSIGASAALLAATLVLSSCSHPLPGGPSLAVRSGGARPVATTITIDSAVGETFAPPKPPYHPAMSAEAAWVRYARSLGSHRKAIPSSVSVRIGLLTLPVGPVGPNNSELYTAHNELTYGYSWHSCPVYTLPVSPPPHSPCIEWLFLDANTGHMIDDTWQQ